MKKITKNKNNKKKEMEEKMKKIIKNKTVLIDSDSALEKMEPFIAGGCRGINFLIGTKDLEEKAIDSLRHFSSKYRMRVIVRDKRTFDMIGDMMTNAVVGANIGFALWVFVPFAPGLATCILGGAAIGALAASLEVEVTRGLDGSLIFVT